jgi:hypothetical protein
MPWGGLMPSDAYLRLLRRIAQICSDRKDTYYSPGGRWGGPITAEHILRIMGDQCPLTSKQLSNFLHDCEGAWFVNQYTVQIFREARPHRFFVTRLKTKRKQHQPKSPALPPTRFEREDVI